MISGSAINKLEITILNLFSPTFFTPSSHSQSVFGLYAGDTWHNFLKMKQCHLWWCGFLFLFSLLCLLPLPFCVYHVCLWLKLGGVERCPQRWQQLTCCSSFHHLTCYIISAALRSSPDCPLTRHGKDVKAGLLLLLCLPHFTETPVFWLSCHRMIKGLSLPLLD